MRDKAEQILRGKRGNPDPACEPLLTRKEPESRVNRACQQAKKLRLADVLSKIRARIEPYLSKS